MGNEALNDLNTQHDFDLLIEIPKVWEEKHRPNESIEDFVLIPEHEALFKDIIETKDLPNMMFYGVNAGAGKTSMAKFLPKALGFESRFFNGGKNAKIDSLHEIEKWLTTTSILSNSDVKVVIFDEIDGASDQFKKAFKGFIEAFPDNARFIATTNFIHSMDMYQISRLQKVSFEFKGIDVSDLKEKMAFRLYSILQKEDAKFSNEGIMSSVEKFYPDMRNMIKEVHTYIRIHGQLDSDIEENIDVDGGMRLLDIVFNTKKTMKERFIEIETVFDENPLLAKSTVKVMNDYFVQHITEDKLFVNLLFIAEEIKKSWNNHIAPEDLTKTGLVRMMTII